MRSSCVSVILKLGFNVRTANQYWLPGGSHCLQYLLCHLLYDYLLEALKEDNSSDNSPSGEVTEREGMDDRAINALFKHK